LWRYCNKKPKPNKSTQLINRPSRVNKSGFPAYLVCWPCEAPSYGGWSFRHPLPFIARSRKPNKKQEKGCWTKGNFVGEMRGKEQ